MDLEGELLKVMTKEELRNEVGKIVAEFHGFITKQAAIKIIAAEKGIVKREITTIPEITAGAKNINLRGTIKMIAPIKKYPTGNRSRLVRVDDGAGAIDLLLWNEDAEEAAGMKLGDEIEINNAYEKNGRLSLGYSGYMKITKKASFTELGDLEKFEGKRTHLRSFISKIKGGGEAGFCFAISDGENEVECVLIAKQEAERRLKEKKEIVIENGLIKNGRVIIDGESRLLAKKDNVAVGVVERMEATADGMLIVVGGAGIHLSRSGAFKLLGIKEVPGVDLSTIINLKKNMFIGRNIVIELEGGQNGGNVKGS